MGWKLYQRRQIWLVCSNEVKFFLIEAKTSNLLSFLYFRGGLDLLELKKGTTVKTFIPKVAEGVFTVICMFTDNDEYVLYYHSGKKTLRVFRTSDSQLIANYRMQAELTAIKSTTDGRSLVLGTVDGCLSVFCIVDPEKLEMQDFLKQLPSRDVNVNVYYLFNCFNSILIFVNFSGRRNWLKLKLQHGSAQHF